MVYLDNNDFFTALGVIIKKKLCVMFSSCSYRILLIILFFQVKTSDYPQEQKEQKEDNIRHSKMMAEVFLTRLLKTKV